MCGNFGFTDTKNRLSVKQKRKLTKALAVASEVRGTDATGIAYVNNGNLNVYKRPCAAHKIRFYVPANISTVIGHTRLTTQGSEKKNYNNHPFVGKCGKTNFALTHNGVIENETLLNQQYHLPTSQIETDSHVIVQLLERYRYLQIEGIAEVASLLKGTFTFVLLDNFGRVTLVKGNNPLCIFYFKEPGLYIYASTKEILQTAICKAGLNGLLYEEIELIMGDVLQIHPDGTTEKSSFDCSLLEIYYPYEMWYSPLYLCQEADEYLETLLCIAQAKGYEEEEILELFNIGCSLDEIADFIYHATDYPIETMQTSF